MNLPKIMVMGVGNVLLTDEGLGVRFLEELEKSNLPENVELIEGGTTGLDLVHLIQDVDFLIIVDAINAHSEPGAIFRFCPEENKIFPDEFQISFHQVGIVEVLSLAGIIGHAPKTLIYGVQPKSMEWSLELTPEIKAVFPKLLDFVLDEIRYISEHGEFKVMPHQE